MNKIFTQIALGVVCLFANVANAQVNENFNNPLVSCWTTNGVSIISDKTGNTTNNVLTFSNNGISTLATPYIDFNPTAITINFSYKLLKNNNGNSGAVKYRNFQVGYQDVNGNFTALTGQISVTSQNFAAFTAPNNNTFEIPKGIYRITIKGDANGSNENIAIDDLKINGAIYHYTNPCNATPETNPDTYTMVGYNMFPFTRSVLANDIEKDGETMITTLEVPSPDGNVVLKADGTFTFKPNADFTGTSTTFTYRATDNGYDAAYSTAVVTINLIEASTLPVAFVNFSGSVNNNKAQLAWSVADNETGNHFQVEKSNDGKTFQTIATVMCSTVSGLEKYNFNDPSFNTNGTFYRIKAVNNDQSKSYTQTIYIKGNTSSNGNKLTILQNPVNSTSLTFNFEATASSQAEVTIYSFSGSKMHTQKLAVNKGNNTVSLPLSSQYTTGHYILEVKTADNRSTAKFVKL